jgi:hypothetical protein
MALPGPAPLTRTVVSGSWSEIYRLIRETDEPVRIRAEPLIQPTLTRTVVPGSWSEIYREIRKDGPYVYVVPPLVKMETVPIKPMSYEEMVESVNNIIATMTDVSIEPLDI